MTDLFSSNLIERQQALDAVLNNPTAIYPMAVVLLGLICWRLKEWI